jgi:hypothetical protein
MSKLANLISKEEGFGIIGSLPTRNNNPGDLRHSPHSQHNANDPNGIGIIDNATDGWADLERQLKIYAERGMTLAQAIAEYAPPNENNSAQYLAFVCAGLGCDSSISMTEALAIP